jgi:hypothetical protein
MSLGGQAAVEIAFLLCNPLVGVQIVVAGRIRV